VAYQLVDTGGAPGTVLAQNSFNVSKQWLRYGAHTASDDVFQKLTGIKGAFRTRIAYVVQTNGGQFPYELRVSDYDGYNSLVHRSSQPLMSPAWSPDGSKLAYVPSKAVVLRWLFRSVQVLFVRSLLSRVTTVRRRSLRMVLKLLCAV
jgi:TolB protein